MYDRNNNGYILKLYQTDADGKQPLMGRKNQ